MTDTKTAAKLLQLLAARQKACFELAKFASGIQKKYTIKTNEFYIVGCNLHGRTAKMLINMATAFDVIGDEDMWTAFGWPYIQTYIRITTPAKRKRLRAKVRKACQQNGVLKSPRKFFLDNNLTKKRVNNNDKNKLIRLAKEIAKLAADYYPELLADLTRDSRNIIEKVT